jgi:hypothetical protein
MSLLIVFLFSGVITQEFVSGERENPLTGSIPGLDPLLISPYNENDIQ